MKRLNYTTFREKMRFFASVSPGRQTIRIFQRMSRPTNSYRGPSCRGD